ncbi:MULTISPECIES: MFS transporter [unclassified Francisella]|uniref:MFS transporter n=1 Tax=unclassified Francisella TaxID=2610885 RepID=UPI002E32AE26|nr:MULTISPECIES: MFS transporter [unclassified Francisella]MED7819821.1 MFS transporter [Francisella sp. 19S2-4]
MKMFINIDQNKIRMSILLTFFILMGMSIDLFAPSLPGISSSLNIDASVAKMVISIYLIGYALGNFIIGIITDAIGRRTLLRISCLLFVIVSLLPPLIPNEYVLLTVRCAQGFLMGSMGVLSRGVFSDILPPEKLLKLGPTIGFLWGLGPIVGPIIGGFLQEYFGWEAGFYFFSIITALITIFVFIYIPETIAEKTELKISQVRRNIMEVLANKEFISLCVAMGMGYSMIISFNTLGPFLIQNVMGYSPAYFGKLAIFLGFSFLPAPIIGRRLLDHYSVSKIFFAMTHFFILLILLFFILSYFMQDSIILLIIATMTVYFVCGSVFPLSMGKGISMFRHISGTAAAMMYLINMSISSLVAFIQGYLHANTITNIIAIYLVLMFVIVGLYWYKIKDL